VRTFGGAGDEWARGLAVCPDGSAVAVSAIGPPGSDRFVEYLGIIEPHDQPTLGIVRLARTGEPRWAREIPTGGAEWDVTGIACSAARIVLAVQVSGGALDLGGDGRVGGGAVVLDSDGRFLRHHPAERITSVAVAEDGEVVVGVARPGSVTRYGGDGAARWTTTRPEAWGAPHVSVASGGDVLVGWDAIELGSSGPSHLERLSPNGATRWTNQLPPPVLDVASAEDGTIVAAGSFIGYPTYGDASLWWDGPGVLGFVSVTAPGGEPRTIHPRTGVGAVAVLPDGGVAMLELERARETVRVQRAPGCSQRLVRWGPDGDERSRRELASCAPFTEDPLNGVWWGTIAVGPAGEVWLQGDAMGPFDVGRGTVAPRGRDWLVLRFDP
jgi:hypothetical protein